MTRFATIATFALCLSTCSAQISRQECTDQGGAVVGDIGNGAIFDSAYVCDINGLPPTDIVVASPGEPIASEGEVCCGGTGTGFVDNGGGLLPPATDGGNPESDVFEGNSTSSEPAERDEYTRQECTDMDGIIVGDIGNGAIFGEDYICESSGSPPIANIVQNEEPFAIEGEVCCGKAFPIMEVDFEGNGTRPEISVDDCSELGGVLIGDIGDGAIHREDFVCEFTGEPPIGTVIARSGEAMPREGQVCCPSSGSEGPGEQPLPLPGSEPAERDEYTRQECTDMEGAIVGDIGNGAIFEDDYICESSGSPPIANIVQNEEPFAIEGEVCCGKEILIMEVERDEVSRQECEEQDGIIVGDIGDGATRSAAYTCDSNGEAPIAKVISSEGEPIASEGEVCCGLSASMVPEDGALSISFRSVLGLVAGLVLTNIL
jgi:hypothetical protein